MVLVDNDRDNSIDRYLILLSKIFCVGYKVYLVDLLVKVVL